MGLNLSVGTSLLTNQINRQEETEKYWSSLLANNANLTEAQVSDEVKKILDTLEERAIDIVTVNNIDKIRRASAELNGLYGLYQNQISQGKQDIHWLIATDTAQGLRTAKIIESFLREQGLINVNIYPPPQLSTANTESFEKGIINLINELDKIINGYKNQYKIYFNLVGSFKSLQGYLNTIGMFYADEIIYIFEGKNSEIIKIPRLPVTVDCLYISQFKVPLAMMAVKDKEIPVTETIVQNVPENFIFSDGNDVMLSAWGQLLWNKCKREILSQDLLEFPRIKYEPTFKNDYRNILQKEQKIKLQETLAKVAQLLASSQGNITSLKGDGGLLYSQYRNSHGIDHFRVDLSYRISCKLASGKLILYHYGTHDYVETNALS